MKRNKKGFTLGEVLISVAVVGIIMAISVPTTKIVKTSYTSLCYFAFNNVQNIVRELFAGETTMDATSAVMLCKKNVVVNSNNIGATTYVLKPDNIDKPTTIPNCSALTNDKGINSVCKQMAGMLNTSGKIRCNDNDLYSVSLASNDEPYISNLNPLNPNFITTNGHRYYLTGRNFHNKVSTEFGYRLLAVDLNGKRPPNETKTSSKRNPPDIVTFLIMDSGEVFPLGAAADNAQVSGGKTALYLNAKVKGYYFQYLDNRTNGVPEECTLKTSSGNKQLCNYAVVHAQNSQGLSFFSYREAYCNTLGNGETPAYINYCTGITKNPKCPPSTDPKKFDLCRVENVKPSFRYSL